MTETQTWRHCLLAVAGVLSMSLGAVTAQDFDDTGIVRITDMAQGQILQSSCDVLGCDTNANACCPGVNCDMSGSGACGAGMLGGGAGCSSAGCYGQCGNGAGCNGQCGGMCGNGMCGNACGYGACGLCPFGGLCGGGLCGYGCGPCGGQCSQAMRNILCWLNPCSNTCTHSPSHGFRPPTKQPYSAMPVSYQHNYPACWNGGVASGYRAHRPAVYMPTDTTQLGYYYQRVPFWTPRPGMIPPPMQPAEWHQYGNPRGYAHGNQYGYAGEYCPQNGQIIEGVEVKNTNEIAPTPPAASESSELERSASNPNLLPVVE
ncbi:hypothetical protein KOR42_21790 [Thalassoglobus neptunius]|uniref:Stigma-specific protein, Stig1 n=1 Tax=Thalassoglobus neptunius TaxID=1938619 RepID=A0A5C5X912_9PLAN|nr:hypothetical protein [Thalassoglobus neptunius]TWT58793.1 hypothetical protein KOR42_21790 [Thalassoglobus neptunius]